VSNTYCSIKQPLKSIWDMRAYLEYPNFLLLKHFYTGLKVRFYNIILVTNLILRGKGTKLGEGEVLASYPDNLTFGYPSPSLAPFPLGASLG
jgi:hypothetical protein